jgi:hypothetical protein
MQFSVARPDAVRAINQRWLLKIWHRHLDGLRVPAWQAVEAEDLSRMAANLSFLDVMRAGEKTHFRISFHGETVGLIYGAPDCHGKFLHNSKPEPARSEALAAYRQAVAMGRPVYIVHDMADRENRLVHSERLVLPLSSDGESVDRIITSFEFVSPDGAFASHGLMQTLKAPPALRLMATIEQLGA